MSLTAAASGFVVFILSVQVIQAQDDWGVIYTSAKICALKGSTVEMSCTLTYPSRINDRDTTVEDKVWFTKLNRYEPVDLRTDSEYSDRVQYYCKGNICTLRIKDLRESDSAVYKFRFMTNQPGGSYTGWTGVTLSVTDLQVQVKPSPLGNSTVIINIIRLTLVVVIPVHLLLFCLWMRKKKTLSSTTEPDEAKETLEMRELGNSDRT